MTLNRLEQKQDGWAHSQGFLVGGSGGPAVNIPIALGTGQAMIVDRVTATELDGVPGNLTFRETSSNLVIWTATRNTTAPRAESYDIRGPFYFQPPQALAFEAFGGVSDFWEGWVFYRIVNLSIY